MSVLDKILILMKQNKISGKQLASDLEFNKNVVTDWKNGKSRSYMKRLDDIASYLGTTVGYLLGDQPSLTLTDEELARLTSGDDRVHVRAFGGDGTEYVFSPDKWDAVKQILDAMAEERKDL